MLALGIAAAFVLGLLARQLGLPPLVGFLAAGFLLHGSGLSQIPALSEIAHLGVLLLLFSVGLKLRLRNLIRPEVWGVALLEFGVGLVIALALLRASPSISLGLVLSVASVLSFSSTVFAAKILEDRREILAFHGRVTIGILILQDLIAVSVLGINNGQALTKMAGLALLLPLLAPLLRKLLNWAGHEELLILLGSLLALGLGGYGFEAIGLSGELGALAVGMVLSNHPKAAELGDSLWSLREIFLVCFFLHIGLNGLPSWEITSMVVLPLLLLPVKIALFFCMLLAFGLSARTGFLASLSLATYSEFGLIVVAAAVERGLAPNEWLVGTALAVAGSFALAAPLSRYAHELFGLLERPLRFFERHGRHPDDEPVSLGRAEVLVVGMGRVGTGAYQHARATGRKVVGIDSDLGKVERHISEGRRVVYADAEDPLLWHRLRLEHVQVIMLALPDTEAKILASTQLRQRGFRGLISATYVWPEEQAPLLAAGANVTYNYFSGAGMGLASSTFDALAPGSESRPNKTQRPAGARNSSDP